MNIDSIISSRARNAEILKDIEVSENNFIDFSYGGPAEETFPLEIIAEGVKQSVFGKTGLGYCFDRGSAALIQELLKWLPQFISYQPQPENMIVTNGAQEAIALIADTIIDEDDVVISESPTYWRAKSIFTNIGAKIEFNPIENQTLNIEWLESKLLELKTKNKKVKLFYTIPNHQNPTGSIMSLEARKRLIELSRQYGFLILEDDVYAGLTYVGATPPSLISLDNERVIYVGSISNLAGPGLRIGWVVSSVKLINNMLKLKRDGGTNTLVSETVAYLLKNIAWTDYLSNLQSFYAGRLEVAIKQLNEIPADICKWQKPKGGFHIWLTLNSYINSDSFSGLCKKNNVLIMPGTLCTGDISLSQHSFRLSFSHLQSEKIDSGIRTITELLKQSSVK